ncbi:MAG: MEDS domain-containing protein, partial [Solirubrobacteraceae bacterium]
MERTDHDQGVASHRAHGLGGDGHFHHESLFYAGEGEFLQGALEFLREGIEREEPALVAVGPPRIAMLREALGGDTELVSFTDMRVLGANPARIIPAWREFLDGRTRPGAGARGIGEPIWPGRDEAELVECQLHESLLNTAFDGGEGWRLLCPYDLENLAEPVIEAARRSHPHISRAGWHEP